MLRTAGLATQGQSSLIRPNITTNWSWADGFIGSNQGSLKCSQISVTDDRSGVNISDEVSVSVIRGAWAIPALSSDQIYTGNLFWSQFIHFRKRSSVRSVWWCRPRSSHRSRQWGPWWAPANTSLTPATGNSDRQLNTVQFSSSSDWVTKRPC